MTTPGAIIRGDGAPPMDSTVNRKGYERLRQRLLMPPWPNGGYEAPEVAARLAAERLGPGAGTARVLDLGCGTGLSGVALKGSRRRPDRRCRPSPRSLALAAEKGVYGDLTEVDLNADPGSDGRRLPFGDDSFDGLVSVGVADLSRRRAGFCARRCAWWRPGGPVVVTSRDDLWVDRNYADIAGAAGGGRRGSGVGDQRPPEPYLPNNPDYGDRVRVIYLTLKPV